MRMTLDEAIKYHEEEAEAEEQKYKDWKGDYSHLKKIDSCLECAKEHRQLADWLKELKTHREIHDILLQTLVDFDLDICCDDLMDNEEEQKICEENCDNKTKGCWARWAKMKAREVNADE